MIYDTAVIQDPNGMVGSCNLLYKSGCVQGYVIFILYSGLSCQGSPLAKSSPLQLSGTSYPGVVSFGRTATDSGSFSIQAVYYGNYDDNTAFALPCEALTITPPTGVPEFPLGALGSVLLLATLLPMMFAVRSKYGRKAAFQSISRV